MQKFVNPYGRIRLCADRLDGAVIRVGDAIPDPAQGTGLSTNRICGTLPTTLVGGEILTVGCSLQGRYVSVQLLGENKILTLCEVIVVPPSEQGPKF